MWVQRWLARAGLGVSGEGGQFEETVGAGPRMVPKGLAAARFLEGSLDLRNSRVCSRAGDQRVQRGGVRAGRAGRAPGEG